MKKQLKSLMVAFAAGLLLTSCQPETVQPKDDGQLASGMEVQSTSNVHPTLFPVCAEQEAGFIGATGSSTIDYCPTGNCPNPPAWGSVKLLNGYNESNEFIIAINYRLSYGWFVTEVDTKLGDDTEFNLVNGIPQVDASWTHEEVNPALNAWQFRQLGSI